VSRVNIANNAFLQRKPEKQTNKQKTKVSFAQKVVQLITKYKLCYETVINVSPINVDLTCKIDKSLLTVN
jgi:hypothetical protein